MLHFYKFSSPTHHQVRPPVCGQGIGRMCGGWGEKGRGDKTVPNNILKVG